VFERLHKLAEGRTAIFVSHRPATVQMAHMIYVLDGGRITQSGTHADLAGRDGDYARLFAPNGNGPVVTAVAGVR
jgi:ABC-type bacteriocin/lantibiotic exporter with double-glycine peptidase domain